MTSTVQYTPEILRFCQQPNLRDGLNTLLQDPTMVLALKALSTLGTPREIPVHVPGVHHDTVIAHQYHRQLGVNAVLKMLEKMTMTPPLADLTAIDQDEMFTGNLPPEFKEDPNKKK